MIPGFFCYHTLTERNKKDISAGDVFLFYVQYKILIRKNRFYPVRDFSRFIV